MSQPCTILGVVRIFVSSLMSGAFGPRRDAASGAIAMLGYQPVRAEDYPASPTSAQVACLAGVRSADAVVVLGSQYRFPRRPGRWQPTRFASSVRR